LIAHKKYCINKQPQEKPTKHIIWNTPMILYIAEKPSLGRALAEALPKPHRKGDGFITVGDGDVVSWCIGHLLEQAEPDAYHPDYKKWNVAHLPIIPQEWKLEAKAKTKKQLSILKKLIKQAKVLVNVGDPDREGQLLVDEVIHYAGTSKTKMAAAKRCLISDLNPTAVKKSLGNLRDNSEFIPLAASALARARADWLYGMNMTRLCTVQGQQSGFKGVLSIGRVQTPLLGLVVKRDDDIRHFTAKPFYELVVTLATGNTPNDASAYAFNAKWKPSDACEDYMDDEGRVLSRKLVENVASRVIEQTGSIVNFTAKIKKQPPPLPYNLSSLQIDAAKRFGLSAKDVLDSCQQLYEKHKLITYPRSDCRYLPKGHFNEADKVVRAIDSNTTTLSDMISACNTQQKSKAWNDKKVSAHHAIIPTCKQHTASALGRNENQIYQLIARQYLLQFLPHVEYRDVQVDANIAGGLFIAKRKEMIDLGWKKFIPSKPIKKSTDASAEKSVSQDEDFSHHVMPTLKKGEPLHCTHTDIIDKHTSPPKHFTDASLLSAMTGISRYVNDPDIRKTLRETDGLGTEATRAGIIELLFSRDYLMRKGKDIHATEIGQQLINNLPDCVALPDMTAQWECQLNAISQRQLAYPQFMHAMTQSLNALIHATSGVIFYGLKGKGKKQSKAFAKRHYKKKPKRASSTMT
jgi:DNA topoisomerase-3